MNINLNDLDIKPSSNDLNSALVINTGDLGGQSIKSGKMK